MEGYTCYNLAHDLGVGTDRYDVRVHVVLWRLKNELFKTGERSCRYDCKYHLENRFKQIYTGNILE